MKFIETPNAVRPLGPYSQGIATNGLVFVAGTIGADPKTGKVVAGGIVEQTKQIMENIKAILEAGGSGIEKIVKVSVFIKDASYFRT